MSDPMAIPCKAVPPTPAEVENVKADSNEVHIKLDVNKIPKAIRIQLGYQLARDFKRYLKQPGAREAIDRRTRERLERGKANELALLEV